MPFLSELLLPRGLEQRLLGRLDLLAEHLLEFRVVEHIVERLHGGEADFVAGALLGAEPHLHCRVRDFQVVHRAEAVKKDYAARQGIAVVERGDCVVDVGLRVNVAAVAVRGIGRSRYRRRKSLEYGLPPRGLLVVAVGLGNTHLRRRIERILHAVAQRHPDAGPLRGLLSRSSSQPGLRQTGLLQPRLLRPADRACRHKDDC